MEREAAVAGKRVQDAETAIMQELNDMTTAEHVGTSVSNGSGLPGFGPGSTPT